MDTDQFACVFWTDEERYSVVPATDIMGEGVKEGEEATVAWRVINKKKIHTSWFKAKILKYSGNEDDLHLLCDRYAEEKENNALKEPRQRKKTAKGQALEDSGNKLVDDQELSSASVKKSLKRKGTNNDQPPSGPSAAKKPPKKSGNRSKDESKPSQKAVSVEAAQLRAKNFFHSIAANPPVLDDDLCTDTVGNKEVEPVPTPRSPNTRSTLLQDINSHTPVISQLNATPEIKMPQKTPTPIAQNFGGYPAETRHYDASTTPPPSSPPCSSSTPVTSNTYNTPPQTDCNIVAISPISKQSGTPQPAGHTQSFVNLLCGRSEDTSTQSALSGVLAGAICQAYDVEEPQESAIVEPELSMSGPAWCSKCALHKARSEELQAELKELKQRCEILLTAPIQVVGYLQKLTEFLSTPNQDDKEFILNSVDHVDMGPTFAQKTPPSANVALKKSHLEGGMGRQELCPSTGVYIPIPKLKAIHHKAGYDLRIIFHELVDYFFTEQELGSSVAFGTRAVPENQAILNPAIVSAIQAYLLACAQSLNIPPLEPGKIRKMFTNKCTTAKTKIKNKLVSVA